MRVRHYKHQTLNVLTVYYVRAKKLVLLSLSEERERISKTKPKLGPWLLVGKPVAPNVTDLGPSAEEFPKCSYCFISGNVL